MHLVDEHDAVPVRSTDDLLSYFETAGKPFAQWRVGTEHELVGVMAAGPDLGSPPPYEGPHGIGALFGWFAARSGEPVLEDGHMIALSRGDAQLTIEPGGQFELAARPVGDDRDFATDLQAYVAELGAASRDLGLAWLSTGLRAVRRAWRDPGDAQAALRRDARLHADRRDPRARHDDAHRHGAGQPRFLRRGRRRRQAALYQRGHADADRAVGVFADRRRQDQRVPVISRVDLARHR